MPSSNLLVTLSDCKKIVKGYQFGDDPTRVRLAAQRMYEAIRDDVYYDVKNGPGAIRHFLEKWPRQGLKHDQGVIDVPGSTGAGCFYFITYDAKDIIGVLQQRET